MKKILLIVCLAISLLSLSACAESDPPEHVPFELLNFEVEQDPDYIWSYAIERYNFTNGSRWIEWGEWIPIDLSSRVVCFGNFDQINGYGTFRARSDYNWIEIKSGDAYCLKLEKRN